MPIKRTVGKRRLDVLTLNQLSHLLCGSYLFRGDHPEGAEFADDAHRREAWARHREEVLAEHSSAGRRPKALWDYEASWPKDAESESHAVHLLPGTSAEERQQIEGAWRAAVAVALMHATSLAAAREYAARSAGAPGAFFDRHAPEIKAQQDTERVAYWAKNKLPSAKTNGHAGI